MIITHFIQCEKDYIRVLKQTTDENEKEFAEMKAKCDSFDSRITRIADERDSLIVKNFHIKKENDELSHLKELCADKDDFAVDGTPENKMLIYFVRNHTHETPIYITDYKYVNAKYAAKSRSRKKAVVQKPDNEYDIDDLDELLNNTSNSNMSSKASSKASNDAKDDEVFDNFNTDFDLIEYEFSFKSYSDYNIKYNEDIEFYFHIPALKTKLEKSPEIYKQVGFLRVENKDHLNYIRNHFISDPEVNTKARNVFKTTYENIKSVSMQWYSDKLHEEAYKAKAAAATSKA